MLSVEIDIENYVIIIIIIFIVVIIIIFLNNASLNSRLAGRRVVAVEENAPVDDVEDEETERETGAGNPVDGDGPRPSQLLQVERAGLAEIDRPRNRPRRRGSATSRRDVRRFTR